MMATDRRSCVRCRPRRFVDRRCRRSDDRAGVSRAPRSASDIVPVACAVSSISACAGVTSSVAVLASTDFWSVVFLRRLVHGKHAHVCEDDRA